ncbi:MAG: hypothetical protein MUE61_21145 [Vicinamibacterales bacterium]|nr:hypothetical protein [Vicinamibacterales bacterium]
MIAAGGVRFSPSDDAAEGGEALAVRVAGAAEVERRLVADADEEVGGGGVGTGPCHRDRAVLVEDSRHARALERDGGEGVSSARGVDPGLNHLDLHRPRGLRLEPGRPMHPAAVVEAAVHVFQKIRGRDRRSCRVDLDLERAKGGVESHADGLRGGRRDRQRQRAHRQRGDGNDSPGAHLNSAK